MVHPRIKQKCPKLKQPTYSPFCTSTSNDIPKKTIKRLTRGQATLSTFYEQAKCKSCDVRLPRVLKAKEKLKIILTTGLTCSKGHLLCGIQSKFNFTEIHSIIRSHLVNCPLCKAKDVKISTSLNIKTENGNKVLTNDGLLPTIYITEPGSSEVQELILYPFDFATNQNNCGRTEAK